MSDDLQHPPTDSPDGAPIPSNERRRRLRRRPRARKPRVKKLRLLGILIGLGLLAGISTAFGMMMAIASDLPQLENKAQYKKAANSFLYDYNWRPIGLFSPPDNAVVDKPGDISKTMQYAIISVEDKRFWTNPGVDIRGIARAFMSDVTGGKHQGASTIAEQFVKNALAQQNNRTIFEKLREAALAYHLTRKWQKTKILTEYLNTIYFGNGAYGIESAARVYFGKAHNFSSQAVTGSTGDISTTSTDTSTTSTGSQTTSTDSQSSGTGNTGNTGNTATPTCGDSLPNAPLPLPKCASVLTPPEAALLAGMVADPSAFDPVAHPVASRNRRNLVLRDMLEQHYITPQEYQQDINEPVPTANDLQQPSEPTSAPYFTSWLRPQILAAMGLGHGVPQDIAEYRGYYGGLKIRTTLDLNLQQAADQAISQDLPYSAGGPAASLVAIDNKTGEVRAMVGGPIVNGHEDYQDFPFNLATEGHRQPGSAFKPFTLAVALESGYTASSIFTSQPVSFTVPNSGGKEKFVVHNFGNTYSGAISLAAATAYSDNSVFSYLGITDLKRYGGIPRIAHLARQMGIRSPLSTNYAMVLGGLRIGVTPLDMAHAYETLATGGKRVYNNALGAPNKGPTGIAEIQCPVCANHDMVDRPEYQRVLPAPVAAAVHDLLRGPVSYGTATKAAISGVDVAGKTGTTSGYGDAWFVGWTPQMTVAVWMGVPDKLVSMSTLYNGQPVEGGTYPAIIWHDFVSSALQVLANEAAAKQNQNGNGSQTTTDTTGSGNTIVTTGASGASTGAAGTQTPPSTTTPATGGTTGNAGGNTGAGAGGGTGNKTGGAGGGAGNAGNAGGTAGTGAGTGAGAGGGTGAGTGAGAGAGAGGGAGAGTGAGGGGGSGQSGGAGLSGG